MIDLMIKLMLLYYTGQAHRFKRKYENVYQKSVVSLVQIHRENAKQKKEAFMEMGNTLHICFHLWVIVCVSDLISVLSTTH